ncbi:MAG TPA: ATP-binding cassette domain-containing protein [Pseudolysinimonas sp.]|nr:ATP-binding cassette domain-containing protein [Pseudolysinimonas sp.]
MTTLTLDAVTVRRGIGPVISEVSLTVEAGAVTAVVGPNGAGKTSLLESISGIVPVAAGRISLDGTDVTRLSRRARARLGIVHVEQGRAIFPTLTVRENLGLTARTPQQLTEALEVFPELQKRMALAAGLLSGGEQQMLVLARAFAARPRILLIDEMSLGLAPVVFQRLLPVIAQLTAAGIGVLLVEQFAQTALRVSDQAIVVTSGRVSYRGPAADLLASPDTLHSAYLG